MVFYHIPPPQTCTNRRLPHYLRVPELFMEPVGGTVPILLPAATLLASTHQVPGGKSQKGMDWGSVDNPHIPLL